MIDIVFDMLEKIAAISFAMQLGTADSFTAFQFREIRKLAETAKEAIIQNELVR